MAEKLFWRIFFLFRTFWRLYWQARSTICLEATIRVKNSYLKAVFMIPNQFSYVGD